MADFKFSRIERDRMRLNKNGIAAMDCIEEVISCEPEDLSAGAQNLLAGLAAIVDCECKRRRRLEKQEWK